MDELKLCPVPWCERVNKPEFYNPEPKAYCVACPDCGLETNVFATEAEAIAAWNTRAEASSAEPVAWIFNHRADNEVFMSLNKARMDPRYWTETPLYAHPPAAPDTVTLDRALVEQVLGALEESWALNTNYKSVEEPDGYEFTEAPAVIEMAQAALTKLTEALK